MHTYIYREEINTPAKLKLSVKVSNEGNSRNTYRHIIYREYLWSRFVYIITYICGVVLLKSA